MHCLSIPLLHVFREFRPAYKIRASLFYYISLFAPRPPDTESLYRRALSIAGKVLGTNYPQTEIYRGNLKACQDAMH